MVLVNHVSLLGLKIVNSRHRFMRFTSFPFWQIFAFYVWVNPLDGARIKVFAAYSLRRDYFLLVLKQAYFYDCYNLIELFRYYYTIAF